MKIRAGANRLSPYPAFFLTPEGRAVGIKKMAAALKAIRKNPDADYPGWNWFPTPGHFILRSFRDGLDHRINMRADLAHRARHAGATPNSLHAFHQSLAA